MVNMAEAIKAPRTLTPVGDSEGLGFGLASKVWNVRSPYSPVDIPN
jgi:hypothetical protein